MISTMFMQEVTKENSCPECKNHLIVVYEWKEDKMYAVCLTCGHKFEVEFDGDGRKVRKK